MTSAAEASAGAEPRLSATSGARFKRDYEVDATSWALFSALLAAPSRDDPGLRALLSSPPVDAEPAPLTSAADSRSFSCGVDVLDEALTREASGSASPRDEFACRTFAILHERRVVAYYSQRRCFVRRAVATASTDAVPVMLLQRLAVDRTRQGHGLGTTLLRDALLRAVSIGARCDARALCIHALSREVKRFYLARGFRPMPATIDPLGVLATFDNVRRALAN